MKVATVVGARPQFIKAAPVSRAIRAKHDEVLVHTGQHYDTDMSQVFFDQLGIPVPDHHLGVGAGPHGAQTGRMLAALEETFVAEEPDCVLVFGDTNSTLAGALAAAKLHIPVGHVEAGLRSFDRNMPEEVNRVVTDHVSTGLYCPTSEAVRHLAHEGITSGVHLVGDVMVDAFRLTAAKASETSDILARYDLHSKGYWLATVHRPANTDHRDVLASLLDTFIDSPKRVLFPMHPRTKAAIERFDLLDRLDHDNLIVAPPLPYVDLVAALVGAEGLMTDSGGLQKEAYLAGVPCVTLRDTTEWTETITDGWNVLVNHDRAAILDAVESFRPTKPRQEHYGDGKAATRIVACLEELE